MVRSNQNTTKHAGNNLMEMKQTAKIVITAEKLVGERDQLTKDIVVTLHGVREQLAELEDLREKLWIVHNVRSSDIFGDFTSALEFLFTQTAQKDEARSAFGLSPRKTRQEMLVSSAERALYIEREILQSLKAQKGKTYSKDDIIDETSYDTVQVAEERVKSAEIQLAKAKCELDQYYSDLEADLAAKRAKLRDERLSRAASVRSMQEKTRG
jgi:hypothetical protein